MGFDLQRVDTPYANKDQQDWLGSAHGTNEADSITLDAALMLAAYTDGEVPSGVELSQRAGGLYGPYLAADTTAARPAGFLLHGLKVRTGSNPVGALLWHGEVIKTRVPGGVTGTAAVHQHIRLV